MATATISESLKCSICTETLVDPRALHCGHSYCGPPKNCLDYIKHNNGQASKCAVCSKVFQVKVSDLNPLYGIRDAIGVLSIDNNGVKMGEVCAHAAADMKMWCKDCCTPLCSSCVDNYHSEHNLRSYKSVLKEQAQNLQPKLKDLDLKLYQIDHEINQLQLRKQELEEQQKFKTMVNKIVDDSAAAISPELKAFLHAEFGAQNESWKLNYDMKPFEFISKIDNIPFQFENTEYRNSSFYRVRDFNFRARAEVSKVDNDDWLGLHLQIEPVEPKDTWMLQIKYRFTLLNKTMAESCIAYIYSTTVFENGENSWGYREFKLHKDVINFQNGFIVKPATIAVKIEIQELSLTES